MTFNFSREDFLPQNCICLVSNAITNTIRTSFGKIIEAKVRWNFHLRYEVYSDDDDHYYHAREQLPAADSAAKPNFRIWEMETLLMRCACMQGRLEVDDVTKYFNSKKSHTDLLGFLMPLFKRLTTHETVGCYSESDAFSELWYFGIPAMLEAIFNKRRRFVSRS